jgi:hypothetical protein
MTARLAFWVFPVAAFATLSLSSGATPDTPQQVKTAAPATLPERKTVTLRAENLLFSKALAELSKQTGIRVEDARGGPDETISLDLKQATFWQALDALAAAGKARVNLYPTSGRIVLEKRGANYHLPPVSYDGRFRLSVKKVTTSRDLEIRDGTTDLAVEIAWDPDLLPLYLETRPRGLRLVDDRNQVLKLPDEGSSLAPVDGVIALGIDLRLPALPRSVKTIRSLEGELSMIVPSKMLTFTFERLDKLAKTKSTDPERKLTQEDVTCRILDVKLLRDRWTIYAALDYPPGMKQLDTNQSWVVNNEMTLETPDGKKRLPNTKEYALESATARHAVLQYHFRDREGAPRGKASDWRVRYRTPANLIEVPIKFVFKDIPLP